MVDLEGALEGAPSLRLKKYMCEERTSIQSTNQPIKSMVAIFLNPRIKLGNAPLNATP